MSDTTGARKVTLDMFVTELLRRAKAMNDAGVYDEVVMLVQNALLKSRRS